MDAPASRSRSASTLKRRVLTGAALIAGLLAALYGASDALWSVLMVVIVTAAVWEWGRLMRLTGSHRQLYTGAAALASATMVALDWQDAAWVYLPALAFWVVMAPWWLHRRLHVHNRVILGALGWLILLPAPLAMIRLRADGPELLLAVLGVVVVADSVAYFVGRRYGRRKLAPLISPGKTWEGVLGAWLAVTLYALGLHFLWPATCGLACLPLSLVAFWALFLLSVLGDLFESWMKREAGVKDSGSLLPGHGGVLDRIDSQIAVLPAATLFWLWMP
ncbi:MAG: phosphatidate cytidylyltransferase [Thiobacillaceae bacterium]